MAQVYSESIWSLPLFSTCTISVRFCICSWLSGCILWINLEMCRCQILRIAVHRLYTIFMHFSCWISTAIRNLCRDEPKVSKICICPANIYVSIHCIYPWMLAKPKESRRSICPPYISSSSKTNFPLKTISNHSKLIYLPLHYQLY